MARTFIIIGVVFLAIGLLLTVGDKLPAAEGSNQRRIGVVEDNIRRFARGTALTHVLDKAVGY